MNLTEIRNSRKHITAECFTPSELVSEMLDKLPEEVWTDPTKTFLDPSGGSGNFIIEILKRKLYHGHNPLIALSSVFSVELMPDNVCEMKERLLNILPPLSPEDVKEARKIVDRNIKCHNALLWDFENWRSNDRKTKKLF